MPTAPKQLEHLAGVLAIAWFAKDLTFAFGDGIAAEDDAPIDAASDVLGLLEGQARDQLLRRLTIAGWRRSSFCTLVGRNDGEVIAALREELPPSGRAAGEDQGEGRHKVGN